MTAKTVTVFGGSGFVGRNLVQRLCAQGWRVRVAVRHPHSVPELRTAGDVGQVQFVQANVRDKASVEEAVKGADVVVNLAGLLAQTGKQKFTNIHTLGAQNVATCAAAAGASRLIHMSALGANLAGASRYGQTKAAGEIEVSEAFERATILRPSVIFGERGGFVQRFSSLIRMLPIVPLVGGGKTRFQPIFLGDVVDAFMAAIERDETAGRTYELGGPQVFTLAELQKMIAGEMGRARLFVPLPFWMAKIQGFFLQIPYAMLRIPALLTLDQVRSLENDNVVEVSGDDNVGTIEDLLPASGGHELVPLGSVLSDYMVRFRPYGQYDDRPDGQQATH